MSLLTTTNFNVEYKVISNVIIFKELSKKNIQKPNIPTYIDDRGIEQENPFSPKYADALIVHQKEIEIAILEITLDKCVIFNEEWKETPEWKQCYDIIMNQSIIRKDKMELSFLKFFVFTNIEDISRLTEKVFLTETLVHDIFTTVSIERDGVNIHKAYLKNTVETGIEIKPVNVGIHQLVSPIDEYNTCIESNMDWSKWYNSSYTLDEKASAVALHRLNIIKQLHSDDAVQIETEKQSKRKNN